MDNEPVLHPVPKQDPRGRVNVQNAAAGEMQAFRPDALLLCLEVVGEKHMRHHRLNLVHRKESARAPWSLLSTGGVEVQRNTHHAWRPWPNGR